MSSHSICRTPKNGCAQGDFKPSGRVAYVCKVDLADIILSAETAALEDGLINALQHHSIRSILGTATNVYCFGVDGGKENEAPCPYCAPLRALNEQFCKCRGF